MKTEPTSSFSRREFLRRVGAAAPLLPATLTTFGQTAATAAPKRKTVALIATEVRPIAHAEHFIDRFLEGYGWQGKWHHPAVDLVSLYVDQFPEKDLARDRSKRFNVPIHATIEEALTRGGSKLAVDGVIIIGEHGKYPKNEKGQTLYPRHKWFKQVVKIFEESGRAVPVFNDKHLSTSWAECVEMVKDSKRLDFPFLAGSSLPVTWRIPDVDLPVGTPMTENVCVGYGGVDSYDIHGLETAQCMAERRRGGESGVKSVLALKGDKMWNKLKESEPTQRLFLAALARSHSVAVPPGYGMVVPTIDWARRCSGGAYGYFIEHNDGFRTALFMCGGLVRDFNWAGLKADGGILSCQMHLPMPFYNATTPDFFNPLANHIEQMVLSHRTPYPVERTLLTSGVTIAAVESLHRGQTRIETPELNVAYQPATEPTWWKA